MPAQDVTFKTILKNAIDGFNTIQNKINLYSGQLTQVSAPDSTTHEVTNVSSVAEIIAALKPATLASNNSPAGEFSINKTISTDGTIPNGITLENSPGNGYSIKLVTQTDNDSHDNIIRVTEGLVPTGQIYSGKVDLTATGDTKYLNIDAATLSASSNSFSSSTDVSLNTTDGTNNGTNVHSIVGTSTEIEPSDGYYLSFTGSVEGSTGPFKIDVTTPGYITGENVLQGSVQYTGSSNTEYFPLQEASFTTSDSGTTPADITTVISAPSIIKKSTPGTNGNVNLSDSLLGSSTSQPNSSYYIHLGTDAINPTNTKNPGKIIEVKTTQDGYVPANRKVGSALVTVDPSEGTYFPVKTAAVVATAGVINGSNITPSITITGLRIDVSGSSHITNTGAHITNIQAGYLASTLDSSNNSGQIQINSASAIDITSNRNTTITHIDIPDTATENTLDWVTGNLNITSLGKSNDYSDTLTITNLYQNLTVTNLQDANGSATGTGTVTLAGKTVAQDGALVSAQYHNGYVTGAGWIEPSTNVYTLTYDSIEECVDFVWND